MAVVSQRALSIAGRKSRNPGVAPVIRCRAGAPTMNLTEATVKTRPASVSVTS